VLQPIRALLAALLIGPLLSSWSEAQTQTGMTEVSPGQTVEITAHGVCRRVSNTDALSAMVPHGTPAEWVTGSQSSFLSNVPSKMVATSCVSPEIALRRWSRPGPPGTDIQPFAVLGADYGLTLTSVGTPSRGGEIALSVAQNKISYTPPSTFWSLGYLAEEEDVIPFQAIDAQNVPVTGTLRVRLVGFREAVQFRAIRYYSPASSLNIVGDRFENLDSKTGPNNLMNSLYFFNEVTFDGQIFIHGVLSIKNLVGHVILIDNSPASNTTYAGGTVGNLNGDGFSNTILDAQLLAVRDFVEKLIAEKESSRTAAFITQGSVSAKIFSTDTAGQYLDTVRVYAVNSGLTYVGDVTGDTEAETRSSVNTLLAQVQRSSNTLRIGTVLTGLEAQMPAFLTKQFAAAIHLLSPGTNTGGGPTNLARFNTVGTGNLGTPIFAFYSGGNAGSAEATFMAGLDREGQVRHMSSTPVFGGFSPPKAITPYFVPRYWTGSAWESMRRADNSLVFQMGQPAAESYDKYRFSFRILPSTDQTCYRGSEGCVAEELAPMVLTGFTGINPENGAFTDIQMQVELYRNALYRVHYDRYADYYNGSGGLVIRDGADFVEGQFTPTPP
jgi:hypothetical protein